MNQDYSLTPLNEPQVPDMIQVVTERKNLRIRLDPLDKDELDKLLDNKRISLQDAMESLVKWAILQDDTVQSVIFGQIRGEITIAADAFGQPPRVASKERGNKREQR
jgi:hypothetical protein